MQKLLISCIFTLLSAALLGQTDSLPPWRVRAEWPGGNVDSVWRDTVWVWQGPCPDSVMTFRFDREGQFALMSWPCEKGMGEAGSGRQETGTETGTGTGTGTGTEVAATEIPPEMLARVLGEVPVETPEVVAPAVTFKAWVRWDRAKADRLEWAVARDGSCFPPTSAVELRRFEATLAEVVFERARMEMILAFAEERCFTPDQIQFLTTRIQSEDRRLALLQSLVPACNDPAGIDVSGLFAMRSMEERALKWLDQQGLGN